jgi:adenine-specific DNA-methyltransferase
MVQLPEPTGRDDYRSIADIGKERIRCVIRKLETKRGEKAKEAKASLLMNTEDTLEIDLGFKVFKLDAGNIKPWDADFDNLERALFDSIENIKPDRSEADVLYELLLKYGLDLAVPIEERKIAGKTVYIIGAGALIVCLDKRISIEVVEGIAALKGELKPEIMRVVFKDSGFADDVVKTNAVQILRQAEIEDVKSL